MSNVLSVDRRLANVRDRGERDVVKPAGVIHGDKHSIAYQRFARVIDCDRKAVDRRDYKAREAVLVEEFFKFLFHF
jgi:hypothetical protein